MKISLSDHFTYRKLLKFVLPTIVMIMVSSIYGVVDGFFISNFVGKTAFAAVNIVMPFVMILGGMGFMLGAGGTALVAKTEGEGDGKRAKKYFSMTVIFTVILGLLLTVIGIFCIGPVSKLLGATDEMLDDCILYGRICISFTVFYMMQNVFHAFLVAAERPTLGLIVTVTAGLTNIALDGIFVAACNFGLVGAAVATGLGQIVGAVIPLVYFLSPNKSTLRFKFCALEFKPILKMITNGSSELMTNVACSVVSILYNWQLMSRIGENGVDAYGVLMYVQYIFVAIEIGYSVGCAPITAYNYGADNRDELKNIFKKSMILMSATGVILAVVAQGLAVPIAKMFVGYDKELCDLTVHAFRLFSFAFVFSGINIYSTGFFTALNNGLASAILSFLRALVLQSLFVLTLPLAFGVEGIWWATLCTEAIAAVIAVGFFIGYKKKYGYM